MVANILVISDIHLVNGQADLELWGSAQQAAFEEMLDATRPGGALAADQVELICNGDTFDFLLTRPHLDAQITTDVTLAHAKWTGIAAAHEPWFAALRRFLEVPGRRLTFVIGNHDLELIYPSIRSRLRSAIRANPGTVRVCLARAYSPRPDVVVEHGCQYDPWNTIPAIWEKAASPATPAELEMSDPHGQAIGPALLPFGSRYMTHVFLPLRERFPYLDRMVPDLGATRQIALVSLLAPELAIGWVRLMLDLIAPSSSAPTFPTNQEPLALFDTALRAVAGVTQAVGAQEDDAWLAEIAALRMALALPAPDALAAIITGTQPRPQGADLPVVPHPAGSSDDTPHLVIVGHTHNEGRRTLPTGGVLMNTGTWMHRTVVPSPAEWYVDLAAWFREGRQSGRAPRDGTRFTAAWLRADPGAATVGELIAWEDHSFVIVPDEASIVAAR